MAPAPEPETKVGGSAQDLLMEAGGRLFSRNTIVVAAFAVAMVAATLGGVAAFGQSVQARVDAGVKPCLEAQVADQQALADHKREEAARVAELAVGLSQLQRNSVDKEIRDAARFDVLYRSILSGRPQADAPALSVPAVGPDGGGK